MTNRGRRQVEIVSLVQNPGENFSVADLCEELGVEVATIHRDLKELRARGISIHSIRNGVHLIRKLEDNQLRELLSSYLASVVNVISFPKNVSLTVKKLKARSLDLFVILVRAIEQRKMLEIEYYKMFDDEIVHRVIEPYDIIPTSRDWRLIAKSDGYLKQFLVENIREAKIFEERFERSRGYDSGALFRHSLEYWRSDDIIDVAVKFSKRLARVIKSGIWSEDQEMTTLPDGSVVLKMKVNSLEQVANWILTWGGDARVMEPRELRKYVVDKATNVVKVYRR